MLSSQNFSTTAGTEMDREMGMGGGNASANDTVRGVHATCTVGMTTYWPEQRIKEGRRHPTGTHTDFARLFPVSRRSMHHDVP